MGATARIWQVELGGGAVWKPPPGAGIDEFPEDDLDDDGRLELDQSWRDIEACLEQLGVKAPWHAGEDELDGADVQRLATRLWPLTWEETLRRGIQLKGLHDAEYIAAYYEQFRHFVLDAAAGANGLAWEID